MLESVLSSLVSLLISVVVSLKEKFGNGPLKPRARKRHVFALRTMYFLKNHCDIITKSCPILLITMLPFLPEKYNIVIWIVAKSNSFNKKKKTIHNNVQKRGKG